jgi:hypothetical protein
MKMVLDFFALVGLCASIIAAGFYLGYATYQPECGIWVAAFTKECK